MDLSGADCVAWDETAGTQPAEVDAGSDCVSELTVSRPFISSVAAQHFRERGVTVWRRGAAGPVGTSRIEDILTPVSAPVPAPVVLVHGIRVSGASLHRIAAAIPDREVVFPDLPGHGRRVGETFTLAGAVDTVVKAIGELGPPAIVAGMSMGGYVSMAVAGRHPDLVSGLVAMCATAQPSPFYAAPFRAFGATTAYLPEQAAAISRWLTRVSVGRPVADDMEVGGLALASIKDVVAEVSRFDALGELARYPGPIELINGGWDQFRVNERRFEAISPRAHLTVIPRASHLFPLIQPVVTGRAIATFARAVDAGTHRCISKPDEFRRTSGGG